MKHFLTILDFPQEKIYDLLDRALRIKKTKG